MNRPFMRGSYLTAKVALTITLAVLLAALPGGCRPRRDAGGQAAPDFTLFDLAGNQVTLSALRGQVVLLNFWGTTCPACRTEMLQLQQTHENLGRQIVILALSLDPERAPVEAFVATRGITFTVLLDHRAEVAQAYGVRAIPTLVLIDRQGNIRYRHEGYPGTTTLTRELQELIGEAGK